MYIFPWKVTNVLAIYFMFSCPAPIFPLRRQEAHQIRAVKIVVNTSLKLRLGATECCPLREKSK